LARAAVGRIARTRAGRRLLDAALKDEQNLAWVLWRRCDLICAQASFEKSYSMDVDGIRGFEDLCWLYSSNALNQGLSRLRFDEAAYLYRLVRSLERPRVAELGRYKGGTTFLFAAAGAQVTSIDIAAEQQKEFDPPLRRALERFGLDDLVDVLVADSHTYPVEERRFELIFCDGDCRYEGMRMDFERWWPALVPGGHLIFHLVDPLEAIWPALAERFLAGWRLADELLVARPDTLSPQNAPGGFAHLIKRSSP
jgi:predicted O-methyltransferase YrrM